jgi:hypothetical protein
MKTIAVIFLAALAGCSSPGVRLLPAQPSEFTPPGSRPLTNSERDTLAGLVARASDMQLKQLGLSRDE